MFISSVVTLLGVVVIWKTMLSHSTTSNLGEHNSQETSTSSTTQTVGKDSQESQSITNSDDSQTIKQDVGLFDPRYTNVPFRELVDVKQVIELQRIIDDKIMKDFADQMKQHYERLDENKLVQTEFDNITVNGEQVHWNILDEWRKHDDEYLVIDGFEDKTLGHLYLFVIHNKEPMVLYTKATSDDFMIHSTFASGTSKPLDFRKTENKWLSEEFTRLVNRTVMIQNNLQKQKIKATMDQYATKQQQTFIELSPATSKNYYQVAAPDEVMKFATVNGQKASFKWYGMLEGQGEQMYEFVKAYISSNGKELIVFAYDENNQPVVLRDTDEPKVTKTISNSLTNVEMDLKIDMNALLNSALE